MLNFLRSFFSSLKPSGLPFALGAVKSPEDKRDIPYAAVAVAEVLPASYFNNISKLPVEYQKKIGSCVGHAAAKYKQFLDWLETGIVHKLSPRFLYALAKCRDAVAGEGTYPRLVAKFLVDIGVSTEATVPNNSDLTHEEYVYNRIEANIPKAAFAEAKPFKIKSYAFPNVKDAYELKHAIAKEGGAMLLMQIGSEWWTSVAGIVSWLSGDVIPLRAPKVSVGGHEVWLYGYEDVTEGGRTRTKFYVFNSWSKDWGTSGTAWFYFDEYVGSLVEAITFVDLPNEVIETLKTMPAVADFKYQFTNNIVAGDKGDAVVQLQTFLMFDGEFDSDLYATLLKSGELGFFKPEGVTQRAVLMFQLKYNLAPLDELCASKGASFGSLSRAKANTIITSGVLIK